MAAHRTARLLTSGLFLAGAVGVLVLGATLVLHGVGSGRADAWLLAWSLLFAVGLPVGALVLMALALVARGARPLSNIPRAGRTIPEAGQ
jgi:hypothetical protein